MKEVESQLFGLLESSRSVEARYCAVINELTEIVLSRRVQDLDKLFELAEILLDRDRLVDIFRD